MWKNILLLVLGVIVAFLFYQNTSLNKENARTDKNIEALQDTLHNYKSKFGSQAGYIKTIEANKKDAIALLSIEKNKNKDLINLLDSTKNIKLAAEVKTETKYVYRDREPDTLLKGIKFTRVLKDNEFIDETITVDSNRLSRNLNYRDAYLFSVNKKDNKGWFTGSTLTTTVTPKNPMTRVTGITSVSTIIDKRKPRLGSFLGPALSIDRQGNLKAGISLGVGLTF